MPISFPTTGLTPNVTTYTYDGLTWIWTGAVWQSVGTAQGVQGAQGTTGTQGVQGTQGTQGGTPILSGVTPAAIGTASAGISTSASRDDHVHAITNVALLNANNTFTDRQFIFNNTPANAALLIRGAPSQTAEVVIVQNSAGQTGATLSSGLFVRSGYNGAITMNAGATSELSSVSIYSYNVARRGLVIKGLASQTANLLEVQDSVGAPLSAIDPAGNFTKGDGDQIVLASQIF